MQDVIIVGYGGHAKSVADSINRQGKYNIVGYTDIVDRNAKWKYLGNDEVFQKYYDHGVINAVVGIGYMGRGHIREELYSTLKQIGYSLPPIVDPSATVADTATIGEGSFIGKGVIVNADVQIGKMAIINTAAVVEHGCMVDDFSHVSVGAVLCGNVTIGKSAFVGANATITQMTFVDDKCFVRAGEVIKGIVKNNRDENYMGGGKKLNPPQCIILTMSGRYAC